GVLAVVARRVVDGGCGCPAVLLVEVLEPAGGQLGLSGEHFLFRGRQDAVEPAQNGQGEDYVLVLAALERVADEVRDAPDEADDFAVVRCSLRKMRSSDHLVIVSRAGDRSTTNPDPTTSPNPGDPGSRLPPAEAG